MVTFTHRVVSDALFGKTKHNIPSTVCSTVCCMWLSKGTPQSKGSALSSRVTRWSVQCPQQQESGSLAQAPRHQETEMGTRFSPCEVHLEKIAVFICVCHASLDITYQYYLHKVTHGHLVLGN